MRAGLSYTGGSGIILKGDYFLKDYKGKEKSFSLLVMFFFLIGCLLLTSIYLTGCSINQREVGELEEEKAREKEEEEETSESQWPALEREEITEIAPQLGCLAPDFTLKDLEGKEHTLSNYRGKGVLLFFWTLSNRECLEDIILLEELDSSRDDLKVLTVTGQEDKQEVGEFLKEEGISLPVLLDEEGVVFDEYIIKDYPITFAVNVRREITNIHRGHLGEEGIEKMRKSALGQFELDPLIK